MIEVLPPVVPSFELQSCNNSEVQLVINNSDYDIYEIDYGDGSPLVLIPPTPTHPPIRLPGLDHTTSWLQDYTQQQTIDVARVALYSTQ